MSDDNSLKGKFLVASPELNDSNFFEGVVFLCEHNDNGAYGLIINKKSNLKAETHFGASTNEEWISYVDLYIGGPVHPNHILILRQSDKSVPNEKRIIDDIVLLNNLNYIKKEDVFDCDSGSLRLYLGCAGWDQGQLENEISQGAWKVLSYDESMIFSENPENIWKDNLARIGGKYSILSKLPKLTDILKN